MVPSERAMSTGFIQAARPALRGCQHSREGPSACRRSRPSPRRARLSMTSADGPVVMVNGLPGKMAEAVAEAVVRRGLQLAPVGLTGDQVTVSKLQIEGRSAPIDLVKPAGSQTTLEEMKKQYPSLIAVDYTHPSACNGNADAYAAAGIDFVMGTTGGDAAAMCASAESASISAVIAPNMGKQIVAFQAAMELMAESFPGAFDGYTMTVRESHQSTKADTSGTAKAIVAHFNKMGPNFGVDEIEKVRVPEDQVAVMKVPEEHLKGHAFHTYRLTSPDGTVSFEFQHNVVGRKVYAEGTVDAVEFLARRRQAAANPNVYTMIDILKEGAMS